MFNSLLVSGRTSKPLSFQSAQQCVEQAIAECRGRVGLRVQLSLPVWDPWTVLSAWNHEGRAWFAWSEGRQGLTLAAQLEEGPVAEASGSSGARSTSISDLWMPDRTVHLDLDAELGGSPSAPALPLAMGGRAFGRIGREQAGPWQGWPSAWMTEPRVALIRDAQGACSGIIQQAIGPHDPPATVARQILARVERLRAAAMSQSPVRPRSADSIEPEMVPDPGARAQWQEAVTQARAQVLAGRVSKLVPARRVRFDAPRGRRFDALATLRALRHREPEVFCFGISRGRQGTFLGATPELLLRVEGSRLESQALAGTISRGDDTASDEAQARRLMSSAKDRVEHAVVVDAIRAALGPDCSALTVPSEPEILRLSRIMHLKTAITGQLCRATPVRDLLHLVGRLHPTPAVAGWPQSAATQWILEHETRDRGWFAGPIGYLTANGGTFAVAIRSALLRGRSAWAFAGAGVVAGSSPEAEWHETIGKLATVRSALTLDEAR